MLPTLKLTTLKLTAAAVLVASATALAVPAPASAASYSCMETGRLNAAEQRVCNSRWLSALDERLDSWYRRALVRAGYFDQTATVRSAQRNWLDRRNACGSSWWCLRTSYRQRIRELKNYVEHV